MTLRVLMTARDAGAAFHLIEIANAARRRGDIALDFATQEPATRYFRAAGIATRPVDLPSASRPDTPEGAALLRAARQLIDETRPEMLLSGLSTPFDAGIDEAAVAAFDGPSFVMQDFWGEANLMFGKPADLYLALDEEGVRLSAERHGLAATVVGSPRHSAYADLDLAGIRAKERRRLGISPDTTVFGFFGQALHALEGYRRTLRRFVEAVLAQERPCAVFYRPHPRESAEEGRWTYDLLRASGVRCVLGDAVKVEHALLACDVVCSMFSNCSYDVAYLNYFSPAPLITPVSLFFDADIVAYFRRMVRLAEFPYLKTGLVKAVREAGDLAGALAEAAAPADRARHWRNARSLADPSKAADRVLDAILARRRGAARPSPAAMRPTGLGPAADR